MKSQSNSVRTWVVDKECEKFMVETTLIGTSLGREITNPHTDDIFSLITFIIIIETLCLSTCLYMRQKGVIIWWIMNSF